MDNKQVAEIIEGMARSIEAAPLQFQINVEAKASGPVANVQNGGTGYNIAVTGGAQGSTTTGMSTSASSGNIEILWKKVEGDIKGEMHRLVTDLDSIAAEFRKPDPAPATMRNILASFGAWVPAIITGTVSNLISHQLGA